MKIKSYLESNFLNQIKMLQSSSKETVVHADSFNSFPKYMHTERVIEAKVVQAIETLQDKSKKQLILLSGSVGDGKSHLLSYLKDKYPHIFEGIMVHNDATESHDPGQSSIETLEKILSGFNDGENADTHAIVAINMGVLHNFINIQEQKGQFCSLRQFIARSKLFDEEIENEMPFHESFQLYNFASERIFTLTASEPRSPFLSEILRKIVADDSRNPIYKAWKQDMETGNVTIAHANYELLQLEAVRERILEKLYHVMLRDKVLLSTRAFYHFIFTIVVPAEVEIDSTKTGFSIRNTLPNLLFNHPERSSLLENLNAIDPLLIRNKDTDEMITNLHILSDKWGYIEEVVKPSESGDILSTYYQMVIKQSIQNKEIIEVARFIIRLKDLLEPTVYTSYHQFSNLLYSYYKGETGKMLPLFNLVKDAFKKWKGTPQVDYYFMSNDVSRPYRIALPVKLKEDIGKAFGQAKGLDNISCFENYMTLGYSGVLFDLDLRLYELLLQVRGGYRPNVAELNSAIQFEDFYKQLLKQAEITSEEVMIVQNENQAKYIVSKPSFSFSEAKFEVRKVPQ